MEFYKKYVIKYVKFILTFTALILLISSFEFIIPIIIRTLLNNIELIDSSTIIKYAILYLICYIILYIFKLMLTLARLKLAVKFRTNETKYLYEKLFQTQYSKLSINEPTYYVSRIKDSVNTIYNLIGNNLAKALISIIILSFSLIYIYKINSLLANLLLLIIPLNFISYRYLNKSLMGRSESSKKICAKNHKNIVNVSQNMEYIKQSHEYSIFSNIIGTYILSTEKKVYKLNLLAEIGSLGIEFFLNLLKSSILLLSIYFVYINKIHFGDLVFIQLIMGIYGRYLTELTRLNLGLRDVKVALQFIHDEILNAHEEDQGKLELESVDCIELNIKEFKYDRKQILRNMEIKLKEHKRIGIMGESGCGKSTLVKLITRLYPIDGVKINGHEIREFTLTSLRKKVVVVCQRPVMFPGTIKDNIIWGNNNSYCEKRYGELLQLPFLKYFDKFDKGVDTVISENASNLSGGERQRIAIARMMLREPEVVILDESVSSLDMESSNEILNQVYEFLNIKWIFIISHRHEAMKYCDKIYHMKSGELTIKEKDISHAS